MPVSNELKDWKTLVAGVRSLIMSMLALFVARSFLGVCMLVIGLSIGWCAARISVSVRGRSRAAPSAGIVLLMLGLILPAAFASDPAAGIVEIAALLAGMALSSRHYSLPRTKE